MDIEAQVQVASDRREIDEFPARLYADVIRFDPYGIRNRACDAACRWFAEHTRYKVCGGTAEQHICDEDSGIYPEELETRILLPVCKRR